MATPNLASVSTITPKNAMGNLGDTSTISVPADSTLSFLDATGPIWLDETDLLAVTAGTASDLAWHVSYEEMAD